MCLSAVYVEREGKREVVMKDAALCSVLSNVVANFYSYNVYCNLVDLPLWDFMIHEILRETFVLERIDPP